MIFRWLHFAVFSFRSLNIHWHSKFQEFFLCVEKWYFVQCITSPKSSEYHCTLHKVFISKNITFHNFLMSLEFCQESLWVSQEMMIFCATHVLKVFMFSKFLIFQSYLNWKRECWLETWRMNHRESSVRWLKYSNFSLWEILTF